MEQSRLHRILALVLSLFLFSSIAVADESKPRYVAASGQDSSQCRNAFRPCRSLVYAISQAQKSDPILVGEGEYRINSLSDLYILLHANIQASMDKPSHYTQQSALANSALIGVPLEYRENFESMGFKVLVDSKGHKIEKSQLARFNQKSLASRSNHARTDCNSGMAGSFPCENINLLAHLNNSTLMSGADEASDVWGFVDLNTLREYVIIGLIEGVALVEVTDPENPQVVGTNQGLASIWRDIKIYQEWDNSAQRWQAWAYITTEANMGMVILDLGGLPNSFSEVSFVSDFTTAHNVYLNNVDYTFGVARDNAEPTLTVAGANLRSGSYRLYNLNNPARPGLINPQGSGYMHDAGSVQISDNRKNDQCVNAASSSTCKLLADFNEDHFEVWDISDPASPSRLSRTNYVSVSYVHSGWWSEDGFYLYVHDELDERNFGLNTTVRTFDMSDLSSPQLTDTWTGPTRAIDHNGFVRGNRYYISNYTEGLTVLDLSNPAAPETSAWFDTEPLSNSAIFEGAWGVYPFLPSGTLAISDINTGLYLLEDASLQSENGSIAFNQTQWSGMEGENLQIVVNRLDAGQGEVSVRLLAHYLNADSQDVSFSTSVLNWSDGDLTAKNVNFDLIDDALNEGDELLVLRLESPSGGASLSSPNLAYIRISDAIASSSISALNDPLEVAHSQDQLIVTLQRNGPAQGIASLDWSLTLPEGLNFDQESGTQQWEDGDFSPKTLTFDYQNKPLEAVSLNLNLSNPINTSLPDSSIEIRKTSSTPAPTPTPTPTPSQNSSGGGSGSLGLLGILALLVLMRVKPRARHW